MNTQGVAPGSSQQQQQQRPSPQQILQMLMQMDPQKRTETLNRNPQLRVFVQTIERQRKQQQQQQQLQQQQGPPQFQQHMPPQQPPQSQQQHQQPQQHYMNIPPPQPQHHQQPQPQRQVSVSIPSNGTSNGIIGNNIPFPQQPSFLLPTPSVATTTPSTTAGTIASQPTQLQQKIQAQQAQMQQSQPKRLVQLPNALPIVKELPASKMPDVSKWSEMYKQNEEFDNEVPLHIRQYEEMLSKDKSYLNTPVSSDMNTKLLQKMFKSYTYYEQVKSIRMKAISKPDLVNNEMWGPGYCGYGNGITGNKLAIVYPMQSKMGICEVPPPVYTKDGSKQTSNQLIPIRLEFDIDRDEFKLNDIFMWDPNDSDIVLTEVVIQIVEDFKLVGNKDSIVRKILNSCKEQIEEFKSINSIFPLGSITNGTDVKQEITASSSAEPAPVHEVRVPIVLNITVANNQLNDKFEWSLSNSHEDIVEFAKVLCSELALPDEFLTAIVHSMVEQCQMFTKSLHIVGYKFDGSPIVSEDLRDLIVTTPVENIHKSKIENYGPNVEELEFDEFDKIIKERERELRRKKRTNRGGRRGGFVLPDLEDPPSTFSTPVPSSVLPGAADIGVPITGYTESLHSIEVPMKQQMNRAKELERMQRMNAHFMAERDIVRRWLRSVMERRMRGGGLASSVRADDGRVIIKFAWR